MLTVRFDKISVKPGDVILDLGCGEGRHTLGAYQLLDDALLIGIDLNYTDVQTAKQRFMEHFADDNKRRACTFIQTNGMRLPFAANAFDHVICSEVLEHIENYRDMLAEVSRVLKPGGTLAVSVPRAWPEKICWWLSPDYHNVEGGHVRIFNAGKLRRTIENMRYRHYSRHWAHALHVPYWWLKCVFWHKSETFFPLYWYHRLLVWDLFSRPWITQTAEKLLNPLMGKSVVMYFIKQESTI